MALWYGGISTATVAAFAQLFMCHISSLSLHMCNCQHGTVISWTDAAV
jgi:hypothetical protein